MTTIKKPNLLFAACEDGIYASFDAGKNWSDLHLNLVHLPVYDLQIQPDFNDLIAGTHGRGFAILDDITPLENLAEATELAKGCPVLAQGGNVEVRDIIVMNG